jgi:hypothetical protein
MVRKNTNANGRALVLQKRFSGHKCAVTAQFVPIFTLFAVWVFMVRAVAQLVEALRYKPEGRGFDSRWCHWNFSLT